MTTNQNGTMASIMKRPLRNVLGLGVLVLASACGGAVPSSNTPVDLGKLRSNAKGSTDGETVGRWLLDEMFAPGGTAKNAEEARATLDKAKDKGLYASLGAAIYDETHGDPKRAAKEYVETIRAAKPSTDPAAPLAAWYATHHLVGLRGSVAGLWEQTKASLNPIIDAPGNVGWRALAELHEWSTAEAFDRAEVTGDAYDALVTGRMGCALNVRIAGPFGHGTAPDRRRSFAAERAPWPPSWPEDPSRGTTPHVLKTERNRCLTASVEQTEDGIFYAETYFDAPEDKDLLIAVQGSVAVWVDDVLVGERDLRNWGIWQRFGAAVRVPKGRHRVSARILNDAGSIRLMNLDGTAAKIATDGDASKPYGLARPQILPDPNPIQKYVAALSADPDAESAKTTPLVATLSAEAAHIDGLNDVASTALAPFVTPKDAAPEMLLAAARFAHGDIAYPEQNRRATEKSLYERASSADPKLWYARGWLVLDDAEQRGLVEAVDSLRKIAADVPQVPEVTEQLVRLYGRLGWRAERMKTIKELAERFPDDRVALGLYASALEEDGSLAEADKVGARLKQLDPDSEVDLDRAIARHDWKAAIAELRRLEKRRPDRREIAGKVADVLMRAGDPSAAAEQLRKALAKNPQDSATRLRLADHAYAKGDTSALQKALAEALQVGSKGNEIRDAIELVEGASLLEPYRMDGRKVIKEFEAWEKAGKHMDGTAARVLDYAATWVHPDGSSEMLEHEIIRIQSQEAVGKESEQQPPAGLVLRIRVIKPDGSILEPEPVAGKPTLTMPHLSVGDYVEIEHITQSPSEAKGRRYRGPHWFFREADKGYWRSEFVVLTPKDKPLEVETVGKVPSPSQSERGMLVERRWRVDESPPAPEEADSPNPREFLPSVRVGWGINLNDTLVRYVDAASEETPLDPRLRKAAREIVAKIPAANKDDQARALYKYIGSELQESNETDGRRAITGRSGSRQAAFLYLVRLLDIPVQLALVKSRIAMPPLGKMSEVEMYDNVLARLDTDKGPRWMSIRDKFAPYAYVPAELRGQPAIRLVAGTPKDTTPELGDSDGVQLEGKAMLAADGSATIDLVQSYSGRMGIRLREIFDKVPQNRHRELVETQLLATNIPGARLRDLKLEHVDDLAAPLVLRVRAEAPQLARTVGQKMVLKSLFPVNIAQIASLAERQTPLLLGSSSHVEVKFEVVAPKDVHVPELLPGGELKDGDRTVMVKDTATQHSIVLHRLVDIPAGRVQPGSEYARFVNFTRSADQLLEREISLGR
ncbi:Cell division protein FtsK [Labilithrix luteola]|uniref:Cell division protein FtsK n=2 Tax=Labilithrix luteola TaxID=1391654 RepID=A0A0K1PUJ1_9BACT|nr:Cell division protein FtsK [Labilithrix luteola]